MSQNQKNIITVILWVAGAILTTTGWFMFGIRDAQASEINQSITRIEILETKVNDIAVIKNDILYIKQYIKELRDEK